MDLSVAADIARIVTPMLGVAIAAYVFFYNKKKDRLEYYRHHISDLQDMNKLILSNTDNLKAFEALSRPNADFDAEEARRMWMIFMVLNRIHITFRAINSNVIDKYAAEEQIFHTLTLFSNCVDTVILLVKTRGYPTDYQAFLIPILEKLRTTPKQ